MRHRFPPQGLDRGGSPAASGPLDTGHGLHDSLASGRPARGFDNPGQANQNANDIPGDRIHMTTPSGDTVGRAEEARASLAAAGLPMDTPAPWNLSNVLSLWRAHSASLVTADPGPARVLAGRLVEMDEPIVAHEVVSTA